MSSVFHFSLGFILDKNKKRLLHIYIYPKKNYSIQCKQKKH